MVKPIRNQNMNNYRSNQIYVTNEIRFYLGLRRKQLAHGVEGTSEATEDEIATSDLRTLYTTENPQWVEAWEKREQCRQSHKKELAQIEENALTQGQP